MYFFKSLRLFSRMQIREMQNWNWWRISLLILLFRKVGRGPFNLPCNILNFWHDFLSFHASCFDIFCFSPHVGLQIRSFPWDQNLEEMCLLILKALHIAARGDTRNHPKEEERKREEDIIRLILIAHLTQKLNLQTLIVILILTHLHHRMLVVQVMIGGGRGRNITSETNTSEEKREGIGRRRKDGEGGRRSQDISLEGSCSFSCWSVFWILHRIGISVGNKFMKHMLWHGDSFLN